MLVILTFRLNSESVAFDILLKWIPYCCNCFLKNMFSSMKQKKTLWRCCNFYGKFQINFDYISVLFLIRSHCIVVFLCCDRFFFQLFVDFLCEFDFINHFDLIVHFSTCVSILIHEVKNQWKRNRIKKQNKQLHHHTITTISTTTLHNNNNNNKRKIYKWAGALAKVSLSFDIESVKSMINSGNCCIVNNTQTELIQTSISTIPVAVSVI